MAVGFDRTTRALADDGLVGVLVTLVVAMLLLLIWGLWFCLAAIDLYAFSDSARVLTAGRVQADFPVAASGRLRPGERALFLPLQTGSRTSEQVLLEVTHVGHRRHLNYVSVTLSARDRRKPAQALPVGISGRVRIATERLTPLQLILRLAGIGNTISLGGR